MCGSMPARHSRTHTKLGLESFTPRKCILKVCTCGKPRILINIKFFGDSQHFVNGASVEAITLDFLTFAN
jgi:hypothetical protein